MRPTTSPRSSRTPACSLAGDNGTWFQPFELEIGLTVGGKPPVHRARRTTRVADAWHQLFPDRGAGQRRTGSCLRRPGERCRLCLRDTASPLPSVGYDDYAKMDVTDKAVLIFSHEPQERDPNSKLNGNARCRRRPWRRRRRWRSSHGARALLVVSTRASARMRASTHCSRATRCRQTSRFPCCECAARRCSRCSTRGGSTLRASRSTAICEPRSRPLPGGTVDLRRAPVTQPPDCPQRRRSAAGQRSVEVAKRRS